MGDAIEALVKEISNAQPEQALALVARIALIEARVNEAGTKTQLKTSNASVSEHAPLNTLQFVKLAERVDALESVELPHLVRRLVMLEQTEEGLQNKQLPLLRQRLDALGGLRQRLDALEGTARSRPASWPEWTECVRGRRKRESSNPSRQWDTPRIGRPDNELDDIVL